MHNDTIRLDRRQFLFRSPLAIAGIALAAEETTRRIFLPPRGGWPSSAAFKRYVRAEFERPIYMVSAYDLFGNVLSRCYSYDGHVYFDGAPAEWDLKPSPQFIEADIGVLT